jgi:prepilin-type N-terminal cleavage/methylation domain-containing protein/prepilin-type processing-associated H-X9-DG protein
MLQKDSEKLCLIKEYLMKKQSSPSTLGNSKKGLKQSFTLIELLIVIAIIGILASLLLPVLGKARKESRILACLGNQKQIAFAGHMFFGDNNNMTPGEIVHGGRGTQANPANAYVGNRGSLHPYNYSAQYKMANPYLGEASDEVEVEVAECPLDVGGTSNSSNYISYGSSYTGNAWRGKNDLCVNSPGGGNVSPQLGINITSIETSPSMMVFLTDGGVIGRIYNGSRDKDYAWHGKSKYGIAFLDGHVANLFVGPRALTTNTYNFSRD